MKIFRAIPLFVLISLAGCAGETGQFPSLLPRPVEQRSEAIQTPEPPAPAPADAQLATRLQALLKQARDGEAAFSDALPATQRAVAAARGAAPASERWVEAQRLISILDSTRVPTTSALATLDSLFIDLANGASRDATIGGIDETGTTRAAVEQISKNQAEQLATLNSALTKP